MSEKQEENPKLENQDEVEDIEDDDDFQDAVENEVKPETPIVEQEESKTETPTTEAQNAEDDNDVNNDNKSDDEFQDIVEPPRINGFLGSQQFTFADSRMELPHQINPKQNMSIWSIIKKVATSDMQRVSLPVQLNEPMTILQKCCEILGNYDLIESAALDNINTSSAEDKEESKEVKADEAEEQKDEEPKENEENEEKAEVKENENSEQGPPETNDPEADTPEASCKRLVQCAFLGILQYDLCKARFKKPFNPILGETYEYVTDDYRVITEQVSHHPPISACHVQGKGYSLNFASHVSQSFKLGGGTGSLYFQQHGTWNFKLDKFNDDIQISKPQLSLNNLIMGGMYFEVSGKVEGHNATTGDHMEIEMFGRSWKAHQSIKGCVKDGKGNKVYDISGNWNKVIYLTNLKGEKEAIWQSPEAIPNAPPNYNFTHQGILLNHITPEMSGTIAPTDSRFRNDQRFFEDGKIEEAEKEKVRLEVKQRAARQEAEKNKEPAADEEVITSVADEAQTEPAKVPEKVAQEDDGKHQHKPTFFEVTEIKNMLTGKMQPHYELVEGDKGYWQKREEKDWEGCPDLF